MLVLWILGHIVSKGDGARGAVKRIADVSAMCRAEVSYSKTIPAKFPFGQRSFLKATFFDHEKHLLISKSILRDDMPAVRDTSRFASPALQHAVLAGWKLVGRLLACKIPSAERSHAIISQWSRREDSDASR